MSEMVERRNTFETDVAERFRWYLGEAGEEVAQRFKSAVDMTLADLGLHPELGRRRRFRNPLLAGLRSFRLRRPFNRQIIFYRADAGPVEVIRLMHGSRDLPRRLIEHPTPE